MCTIFYTLERVDGEIRGQGITRVTKMNSEDDGYICTNFNGKKGQLPARAMENVSKSEPWTLNAQTSVAYKSILYLLIFFSLCQSDGPTDRMSLESIETMLLACNYANKLKHK